MGKRDSAVSYDWLPGLDGVQFKFGDGETLNCMVGDVTDELQKMLVCHGIGQKVGDAGAIGVRTTADGRVVRATVAEKKAAIKEIWSRLVNEGLWNAAKTRVTEGVMLFAAIQKAFPGRFADAEAFKVWVAEQAAHQGVAESAIKTKMATLPKVATAIDEIRKELGKATGVDADALLEDLMGEAN